MRRLLALIAVCLLLPACLSAEVRIVPVKQTAESSVSLPGGDLFYTYLLRQAKGAAGGPRRAKAAGGAGSRLSGTERQIYDILKAGIADVASGARTSTEFTVTAAELGLAGKMWTAAELGVAAIEAGGSLTREATEALNAQLCDLGRVTEALLSDCPYELYWYDKAAGGAVSALTYYSLGGWGDDTTIGFTQLVFTFRVAQEYAADGYASMTDAAKTAGVPAAVSAAQAIVRRHAAKTDYEKLAAYKDEICALTSYNYAAAGDENTPYGNPWQLVWVFDGDPDTKVVCEGYSKAFQYLCDVGSFQSGAVECYSVTGTMAGATGAGGHMWNVVAMDDGKNYLADVTNCDEDSVGSPDQLFLKGVTYSGAAQYRRTIPGQHTVSYVYDEETLRQWGMDLLTVSTEDYDPDFMADRVVGIAIAQAPEKTAYVHGDRFDAAGMAVNLVFGDGHEEPAGHFTVAYQAAGQTAFRRGDTAVIVSAEGFAAEQPVTVSPGTLTLEGLSAAPREYRPDDTSVVLAGGTLSGVQPGDEVAVQIPAAASVESADAGEDKPVLLPPVPLTGAQADCYTLTLPELTVTILPASLAGAEAGFRDGVLTVRVNGAVLQEAKDYTAVSGVYADAQHLKAVLSAAEGGNYTGTAELLYAPEIPQVSAEETAVLPADTVRLGPRAFAGSRFAAVDLGASACTAIGEGAFADCAELRLVHLPGTQGQIAADAFDGCGEGLVLLLPEGAAFTVADGGVIREMDEWAAERRFFVLGE